MGTPMAACTECPMQNAASEKTNKKHTGSQRLFGWLSNNNLKGQRSQDQARLGIFDLPDDLGNCIELGSQMVLDLAFDYWARVQNAVGHNVRLRICQCRWHVSDLLVGYLINLEKEEFASLVGRDFQWIAMNFEYG